MLQNYDPNICGAVHTIRVTFMQWDYAGHIAFNIRGYCKGADLLDFDWIDSDCQEDIDRYVENDCQFAFNEEYEAFSVVLRNSAGEELIIDGMDDRDLKEIIVCIEISGVEDKTGGTENA